MQSDLLITNKNKGLIIRPEDAIWKQMKAEVQPFKP